jgi:hypothetical protein
MQQKKEFWNRTVWERRRRIECQENLISVIINRLLSLKVFVFLAKSALVKGDAAYQHRPFTWAIHGLKARHSHNWLSSTPN